MPKILRYGEFISRLRDFGVIELPGRGKGRKISYSPQHNRDDKRAVIHDSLPRQRRHCEDRNHVRLPKAAANRPQGILEMMQGVDAVALSLSAMVLIDGRWFMIRMLVVRLRWLFLIPLRLAG